MYGKIGDMRRVKLNITKDGKVIFEGKSDDLPTDLQDVHYKSIKIQSGITYLEI